ncbi:MAG: ribonuclease III [Candidatus Margulisiibacteriota bacterium]|jgi:ribonuclease-3
MITAERLLELEAFETKLGIVFEKKELLDQALTHASSTYESNGLSRDNERLEFFGDAVLKLAVSEHLFSRFPKYNEGELTKIRAVVVSDNMLSKKAREMEIGKYLILGNNEERSGGRNRDSNLANALEALFGAYYFDQKNIKLVNEFVINILGDIIEESLKPAFVIDAKSMLQELAQKEACELPRYEVIAEEGPDHNKDFVIQAFLDLKGKQYKSEAKGKSKKEAEQLAARKMLEELEGT